MILKCVSRFFCQKGYWACSVQNQKYQLNISVCFNQFLKRGIWVWEIKIIKCVPWFFNCSVQNQNYQQNIKCGMCINQFLKRGIWVSEMRIMKCVSWFFSLKGYYDRSVQNQNWLIHILDIFFCKDQSKHTIHDTHCNLDFIFLI